MEEAVYTVGQVAEICGTTVRTLQHYDKIGLFVATRSGDKNSRYYSEQDMVKLQQILFYKNLGFTLKEIQELCLSYGDERDLKRILQRQSDVLFKKEMEFRSDRAFIDAMVASLETNHHINLETMLKLTVNRRKHIILEYLDMKLSPEATQTFEQHIPDYGTAVQVYWRWKKLVFEVFLLIDNGIDPGSEAGYAFGEKWHSFVQNATQDSQKMIDAYSEGYALKKTWPQEDRYLMEYCDSFIEAAHQFYLKKGGTDREK
ncbi:MerR family transcriptional regulator [Paenibacillus sp. N3/727]|uniref:MerR family transcriptional regulator n=1 Tax=Paenibacillus sp. N3/727 TaxID=2925845 RepID=UPI001F535861|nr:MerR family transcriptional regulator [Paenibacillus sp. N3/727]UNK17191.1 MerR family transcriptional regulator [Paenibacillus sp. N3/727]